MLGLVRTPHHLLITQMEPWDFIKSLAQNKAIHIKLSLCLSFQLRHNLGGYTVGTTVGFQVETVEVLAPRPHHRIPRRHP
jgi:hypothetical protein